MSHGCVGGGADVQIPHFGSVPQDTRISLPTIMASAHAKDPSFVAFPFQTTLISEPLGCGRKESVPQ